MNRAQAWNLALGLLTAAATVQCESSGPVGSVVPDPIDEGGGPLIWNVCTKSTPPVFPSPGAWRGGGSVLHWQARDHGDADHTAHDHIAVLGSDIDIEAKFGYWLSLNHWDLEGELIDVLLSDCSGEFRKLGTAETDTDGRIRLAVGESELPEVGVYTLVMRVVGDNSFTRSWLRVMPPATKLVIFDIDATLTTQDGTLFMELLLEDQGYVAPARPGGAELTRLLRYQKGYQLVYVTGRPYLLASKSRQWLYETGDPQGFAPGSLRTVDDILNMLPTDSHVRKYKGEYLNHLVAKGLEIDSAYGNALTDIGAYQDAGIAAHRIFIVGEHGGQGNSQALGEGYVTHIGDRASEPKAKQPFEY